MINLPPSPTPPPQPGCKIVFLEFSLLNQTWDDLSQNIDNHPNGICSITLT
eukprot:UN08079